MPVQAPAQVVLAGGKLEAKYEASLAGIAVGKGQWAIDINEDQYSATASGGTAGLLKAFAGGSGSGQSTGRVVAGALVPSNYQAVTTSAKKSESDQDADHAGLCEGVLHRAGAAARSREDSDHRCASP